MESKLSRLAHGVVIDGNSAIDQGFSAYLQEYNGMFIGIGTANLMPIAATPIQQFPFTNRTSHCASSKQLAVG